MLEAMRTLLYQLLFLLLMVACQPEQASETPTAQTGKSTQPNIIIFYVDDLGYGDLSSYGATRVQTPHVDRLAANGLKLTDAHCSAATCTPSRYALLTGSYAFRNNAQILPGDAPLVIDTAMRTLPDMLKDAGYATAVVGKWHLGLGLGELDWNREIRPGPREVGFDYSFLIPATGDRVPCVYVENQRVVGLQTDDPLRVSYDGPVDDAPAAREEPELLRYASDDQHSDDIINGVGRIGYMTGGDQAQWVDEEFPHLLTLKANTFIRQNRDKPFFLYFSFHDIHVPRLPHQQFEGATDMGPRGDAIVQMDWCVGEVMRQVAEAGLAENTLVIFTSDNGPVLNDGYEDGSVELLGEHQPAGPFRGGKYSAYEAGTRVPTIVHWPGTIPQKESAALLSQVDFYASLSALTGQTLGPEDAADSQNLLPVLLGESDSGRELMIEESQILSLRKGPWKYIPATDVTADWMERKGIEGGLQPTPQLYDLSQDPGEQQNLAEDMPEMVEEMQAALEQIRSRNGSRDGF
jgi:arylsulfatase A-like enzyme